MGCLPGDISKKFKIAMLEGDVPIQVFPWQIISAVAAKSYRKDHHKKANRRHRRGAKKEIDENGK
jgi:hypothetical protein